MLRKSFLVLLVLLAYKPASAQSEAGKDFWFAYAGEQWNGTFMGNTCPNGVFVYLIALKDYNRKTRHFNGMFSLVW